MTEPPWDRFAVLLPERPEHHSDHPPGCHRRRISDRIIFDRMLQLLRFGCSNKTRPTLDERGRRHVERTHAGQNTFYERRAPRCNAFFDLTDTVIIVHNLIRRAWMTHRRDERPDRRPDRTPFRATSRLPP